MAKKAIYYEEAKRLFVNEGVSLDVIVGILGSKVSRKTLFNWKTDGDWDSQRQNYLKSTKDLREELLEIAKLAIKNAKAKATPHNVYAVVRAISALKQYEGVKLLDEETTPKDRANITEKSLKEIHRILGLE